MAETANRFLALLSPEQRAKTVFPFEDKDRTHWFYSPGFGSDWTRDPGLMFDHMNPDQQQMAGVLLSSGLSQAAYMKAVTIMSFGPDPYCFAIFGTPSATGAWGYGVHGHHLSQNYTVKNGRVVNGPSFFGIHPAEVKEGPRKGLRTLGQEEDLGFEVIRALDEPLQKIAIVDPKAYEDILTVNSRKAALKGQPSGLPRPSMNATQYDAVRALAELYARNVPDDVAQRRLDQIDKAGRDLWFAWAGGTKPGGPRIRDESA